MIRHEHRRWNIRWEAITEAEAALLLPAVVAQEINRLRQLVEESNFLLSCSGEGMELPAELRYSWPADEYDQTEI